MIFSRYAVYYVPDQPFLKLGSEWLGWDCSTGLEIPQTSEQRIITDRPRKYGFHATIKAPFVLADGCRETDLRQAFQRYCQTLTPITGGILHINRLGRFLAITQKIQSAGVSELAANVVADLDQFRAPLSAEAIEKRRKNKLSAEQDILLLRWGYPYVMQEFQFHMTLSGPLNDTQIEAVEKSAQTVFANHVGVPLHINSLALMGENRDTGQFHLIENVTLGN